MDLKEIVCEDVVWTDRVQWRTFVSTNWTFGFLKNKRNSWPAEWYWSYKGKSCAMKLNCLIYMTMVNQLYMMNLKESGRKWLAFVKL